MVKQNAKDKTSALERLLSHVKDQLSKLTIDPAVFEFEEQVPPHGKNRNAIPARISRTLEIRLRGFFFRVAKPRALGKPAAEQGISPDLVEELKQGREADRKLEEMLSHGRTSNIRRARKLLLVAPVFVTCFWCSNTDSAGA
jgi:hypothetical protein